VSSLLFINTTVINHKTEEIQMRNLITALLLVMTSSLAFGNDPIVTDSTSNSTVTTTGKTETTVKSPPSSAISPSINSSNSDLCTVGVSGAVQTQILGISGGNTVRDMNCERLKLSKTLYDMGMKVAAVSVMCGDPRVFQAMEMAGTPCPYEGKIGQEAKELWDANPELKPTEIDQEERRNDKFEGWGWGIATSALIFALTGAF
jgi:hypothetical protein